MKHLLLFYLVIIAFSSCQTNIPKGNDKAPFVVVSPAYPAYFELSDKTPYIPIGLNMISPNGGPQEDWEKQMAEYEGWMKALSENGGNYLRIWLGHFNSWDIEDGKAGMYSEERALRVDHVLALARKYNLRVKMTFEHFRAISPTESKQTWAIRNAYHTSNGGPLDSVEQYITSSTGQQLFLDKLDYYYKRYGSDPIIFGWELWNEMDAMSIPKDSAFYAWNEKMLKAVKEKFPENLVMQSLGSFDDQRKETIYQRMMAMPGNEVAQVHRYLDAGAQLEVCHGPLDLIGSSAVTELLSYQNHKPVLLAETGGVEAHHAGPLKYYAADTAGIILHDVLFAPFFSGAAGTGMIWHWNQYVAPNNLWHHFDRFSQTVKDVDPIAELFEPFYQETDELRIYGLRGKTTFLLWCRDKKNNWETELKEGQSPELISNSKIDLSQTLTLSASAKMKSFDPWKNVWQEQSHDGNIIKLPTFKRSLVIKGDLQ